MTKSDEKKPAKKKTTTKRKTTAKKKTPVKKTTTKRKKTIKATKPKRTGTAKKKIDFKDATELINAGVEKFEELHTDLTNKLERMDKLIADIRQLIIDKGGDPEILDSAVKNRNHLDRVKVTMDKYMKRISDNDVDFKARVQIFGKLTDLTNIIESVKE